MKIGSLFSGIAGIERGLESVIPSARVIWQAENNPHALAVLARHYPAVRRYADVKEIDETAERPDIVCGGFPCQDISNAGGRAGIDGERSGLWSEFARIVRVLRPGLVFVENVAALLGRGLDRVLGDLAACGYDAEWETLRAADVGAPHLRDRLFILAHREGAGRRWTPRISESRDGRASIREGEVEPGRCSGHVADSGSQRVWDEPGRGRRPDRPGPTGPVHHGADLADPDGPGQRQLGISGLREDAEPQPRNHADRCDCPRCYRHEWPPGPTGIAGWDGPQPAIRRGDDGVPGRSHRLRLLGNSVVPQQAARAFVDLMARIQ